MRRARGGKLLVLQGKIDTIVPASYICDWYSALCKNTGSFEKTRDFARVFLLPGGWHGNISGVDMLGIARNWAEKGIAPESIKATVNVNGQKYTEEAELFVPEEDEEEKFNRACILARTTAPAAFAHSQIFVEKTVRRMSILTSA